MYAPSDCNSVTEALRCIRLGLLQENVEKGQRQDATLATSDSWLKPFKCVTIGPDRAGALVIGVEGFNYIKANMI